MPISSSFHPDYYAISRRWELVRRVIANDAVKYIPEIDPDDKARSDAYREAALLINFTNLTLVGLKGLVFRKPPVIKLPENLAYVEEDTNGEGFTLTQFSQLIIGELLKTGRCGLLVDYPKITPGLSKLEKDQFGFVGRIKLYPAETIENWQVREVGSKVMLSMVKLRESVQELADDGFSWIERTQYRTLTLNAVGIYTITVYDDNNRIIDGPYTPTDAEGNNWDYIPFRFIGSENNDPKLDTIPLYDIAVVNISHYRNSADQEESGFFSGQMTVFLHANGQVEQTYGKIRMGARKVITCGEGSSVSTVQASPNTLIGQIMKDKQELVAAIGARFISPPGGRETAEGARIRFGSANSGLYILTSNASLGIELALKDLCKYQDADPDEVLFNLNSQFYDETADPNLIAQQMVMIDKQVLSRNDVREYGRKTGFVDITRTNEEIDKDIKKEESELKLLTPPTTEGNDGNQQSVA